MTKTEKRWGWLDKKTGQLDIADREETAKTIFRAPAFRIVRVTLTYEVPE